MSKVVPTMWNEEFSLGHRVAGVDIDTELFVIGRIEHPDATWLTRDLAALDLPAAGITEPFELVVRAGHVMAFLDTTTTGAVVGRLDVHTAAHGRLVFGLGVDRGDTVDEGGEPRDVRWCGSVRRHAPISRR